MGLVKASWRRRKVHCSAVGSDCHEDLLKEALLLDFFLVSAYNLLLQYPQSSVTSVLGVWKKRDFQVVYKGDLLYALCPC